MKRYHFACALCLSALVVSGCSRLIYQGGAMPPVAEPGVRVLITPFENATKDENAGRALEQITASALVSRGARPHPAGDAGKSGTGTDADRVDGFSALAEEVGAELVLYGIVHEHRYKTDLDGDPAVGLTLRLVDPRTREMLWQATGSDVGLLRASLTSVSQRIVKDLVSRMPLDAAPEPSAGL